MRTKDELLRMIQRQRQWTTTTNDTVWIQGTTTYENKRGITTIAIETETMDGYV